MAANLDTTPDIIPGYTLGGAVVRRAFSMGGQRVYAGMVLSRSAFLDIGYAVRRIFVREGQITPFYLPQDAAPPPGTAHMLHTGGGRYNVVFGTLLNGDPLTREEAEALVASHASKGA